MKPIEFLNERSQNWQEREAAQQVLIDLYAKVTSTQGLKSIPNDQLPVMLKQAKQAVKTAGRANKLYLTYGRISVGHMYDEIVNVIQEQLQSKGHQPPELHAGDKILKGRFKNSPAEIKGFTKDKHNQPVLKTNKGDVQLFKPRVVKLKEAEFRPTTLKLSDYRGPYHPETMEPYGPEFKDAMALADVVDELIENGVKPKVINISPRYLLATQDWLSDQSSDEDSFPEYRDKPVVLDYHGELFIIDGHHRCANALKNNRMVQVYLFDIMDDTEMINEVNMDSEKGIGATPNNQNIDYFGLRVLVAPTTFLRLAQELTVDPDTEKRILAMAKYIKDGGPVGPPMIIIDIPEAWEHGEMFDVARISGHEGRHRMEAIIKAEGNAPVEVHLTFPGLRRRHITPEMIENMNHSIYSERGQFILGPWFKVIGNQTLAEAEENTTNADEITKRLSAAGYSPLGSGTEATVWSKDDGTVIKILMPDYSDSITGDRSEAIVSQAENSFLTFYNFCQANKNLRCLPKFVEIGGAHHTLFRLGSDYYRQIAMEKLVKIPSNSFEEYMVWLLSDSASSKCSWSEMTELMHETPDEWDGVDYEDRVERMINDKHESAKYAQLFQTMQALYGEAIHNSLGWDLHSENVMMRNNGDLVIIDPFYGKRYYGK